MSAHAMGRKIAPGAAALATLLAVALVSGCNAGSGPRHAHLPVNVASLDSSVLHDEWKGYITDVPIGTRTLTLELHHLSRDADLYVQGPRYWEYCESFQPGRREEICVFEDPTPGEWYVQVAGWDYGRSHYTLTSSLWPSHKHATLWRADQGVLSTLGMDPVEQVEYVVDEAIGQLDVIRSLVAEAWQRDAGEVALLLFRENTRIGHAVVRIERFGGRRTVHLKAAVTDTVTGEGRHYLRTMASDPVILADYAAVPDRGILRIRSGAHEATLRLGSDTGTGQDIQVIGEPGPVVQEVTWEDVPDGLVAAPGPVD